MSHGHVWFYRNRLLLGAACCLLARIAGAQAWDWSYELTTPLTDAAPAATTAPDANGFWSLGAGLVHYRSDGTPDVVRNSFYRDSALSAPLADGGVIFTSQPHVPESGFPEPPPYFCGLRAFSPQGIPRWQAVVSQFISYCERFGIDGAGVSWVKTSHDSNLYRVAADGAALSTYQNEDVADFVVPPSPHAGATENGLVNGGVIVVTEGSPARAIAVNESFAEYWRWTDADYTHRLQKIAYGNDGNLYAAGRVAGENTSSLVVASVTPSGTQRFVQVSAAVQTSTVIGLLPAQDAGVYLLDEQTSSTGDALQMAVQRVGGDGTLQWSRILSSAADCSDMLPDCGFSVTAQGELLIAARTSTFENHLYRYDATGNVLVTTLPAQSVYSLHSRSNGDALLAIGMDSHAFTRFLELDRNGAEQAAPATQQIIDSGFTGSTFFAADDGSSYALALRQQTLALAHVDAQGRLLWRNDNVPSGYQLSAAGDLVCIASDTAVSCFAAADGTPRWSQPYTSFYSTSLRVLDDGSVEVILNSSSNSAKQQVFDHAGNLVHDTTLPLRSYTSIAANGSVVYLDPELRNLRGYDRNGVRLFNVPVPAQLVSAYVYATPDLTAAADGSTLLTLAIPGQDSIAPYAWSLDAHGGTRWVTQLRSAQPINPTGIYTTSEVLNGNDDKVYFVLRSVDPLDSSSGFSITVQARSASDGTLLWQSENVASDSTGTDLLKDPQTGRLLLAGHYARKLKLTTLDASNGAVVRSNVMPCPAETPASGAVYPVYPNGYCTWSAAALAADGTLRIGAFANNDSERNSPYLFALHAAAATPTSVRAQPGIDGAWFAGYESGQGFMLDDLSNGIFMPWFTFAADAASNDPAQLAWYVLQSSTTPGPSSASLAITKADPGTFNSGTVGVRSVGTAHLSFFDCNSALLTYQFDADEASGKGGTIALTRLTPSTTACQLDDTHTTPAQIDNVPAGGFDARQSGSWFDPATAGQGVQFAIIPRGAGFNGLVFAAWFTFDPANNADDAAHAHWFTLQGDLANASGGEVELPILRTVGGALDATPTGNTLQVGHATLTMLGCDAGGADRQLRARLDYAFDDSAVAHAFENQTGTLNLVKIGGCTIP